MKQGLPIVISAPSGTGKGTVISILMKQLQHAFYSISCTTRSPRPKEKEGVNYYFIDRSDFESRIQKGLMLEYNEYVGNLYGTPKKETDEKLAAGIDVIFELDVNGAMHLQESMPGAVLIMIMPPDYPSLEARLRGRGTDTDEVIAGRMQTSLQEIQFFSRYHYFVVNETGKPDQAAKEIMNIIEAERHKTARYPDYTNKFIKE
ncbi:MAG: guanylate kinase [Clostridiales bacterium]|nr:guanylate kinase [Clostridiales bacterium]